jgi:hypothetical protein
MPTILTTNVEPYMEDQFANYTSMADMFSFNLTIPGNTVSASAVQSGNRVFFPVNASRVNLVQDSVLENNSNVVTLLDRAIKLNAPDSAAIGQPLPISTSIFEGLNSQGISLMAVSPDDVLYSINPGNFTFNEIGLWGVVVLDGDDVIIGKTVDVTAMKSPLAGLDVGTILAGISLLVLLSVVPIWLMGPAKLATDPYADITYKAYVIRKYIDKFDTERLQRAVKVLKEEYDGLAAKKARGNREEARKAIEELDTLASI